ncbi:regulator of chromosome condensation 1/beta-lactamase-inhibitor protein II [Aspergillus cavernicola]|uniref:Regulator of chromosome condensation 1/beta-lactamase-inhibitor protein II n=1 Tax=Aspergillus cavernicola TaxID=176166 RepID=A0ABR4IPX2_9EURO
MKRRSPSSSPSPGPSKRQKTEASPDKGQKFGAEPATNRRKRKASDYARQPEKRQKASSNAQTGTGMARGRPKRITRWAPRVQPKPKLSSAIVNERPTTKLNVHVFGANSCGQLGLGHTQNVQVPTLNAQLSKNTVGVVQLSAGGTHCVALTHDNKVLTWGYNRDGQLGRETSKEEDEEEEVEETDTPSVKEREMTPTEVDFTHLDLSEDTEFTQVVATESATFVLTDEGDVIGWGTFRGKGKVKANDDDEEENDIVAFLPGTTIQRTPMYIPLIKDIKALAAGSQHVLAVDAERAVWAWGANKRGQVGRKVMERQAGSSLNPRKCYFPSGKWGGHKFDIENIGAGGYHSFAIRSNGEVYAWGYNMHGQTGICDDVLNKDSSVPLPRAITFPKKVGTLDGERVESIVGGESHSLAVTEDNRCLSWGSIEGAALGIREEDLVEDSILYDNDTPTPRILAVPALVTNIEGKSMFAAAGPSHSIVVTAKGNAFGWGSNDEFEVSQNETAYVEVPTLVRSEELDEARVVAATAGTQFTVLLTE